MLEGRFELDGGDVVCLLSENSIRFVFSLPNDTLVKFVLKHQPGVCVVKVEWNISFVCRRLRRQLLAF